ncbi:MULTISPECIES: PCMD domain-containing protein [Bacteroides]|uniref:PCMD domain-containing protein n=1 Tax=Bacteroides TaxID=816 RepID=UPI000969AB7B|nr:MULTISPECIES: PCMD domain-containing protein [Bacteroides]OKZ00831.1 MAG: hypothetical protein BHV73_05675 [Bacteroides sp. 44_46]
MKKNLFYLFALICSMSLFTACSDDDDAPDYSKVIESEIAGNYKGSLTVTVEGTTMPSEPQKIKIEKASPSAINLSLADFSFMGIAIGDVELKNCALSQNGDTYTFTGTQELKVDALSCTINAKGTVTNGAVKVDMDIDATVGGLKQSVKVIYEGTRLTGSESSEAKIKTFSFDMSNEANAIVIEQPVINDDNTITFRVDEAAVEADANVLKTLVPTFIVSDKATASVESGKTMNLSQDVTITVTAEDGTAVEYVVKTPVKVKLTAIKYNLNSWTTDLFLGQIVYPTPSEEGLATSNGGAGFFNGGEPKLGFPVVEEVNGFEGHAAKLITLDSRTYMDGVAPITSGSLFTGSFEFDFMTALSNPLLLIKFGIPYAQKPLFFKGVYTYKAGDNYIDGSDKENVKDNLDVIDECSIQAVLYEVQKDENGSNIPLTGVDINESERRVAVALLQDGSEKAEWTSFNIPFKYLDGKSYEEGKEYMIAIVCSSSKDGDKFKGAVNSTLIVDELEIIGE